jgi:hypothetical protein
MASKEIDPKCEALIEALLRNICYEARSLDEQVYSGTPLIDNPIIARNLDNLFACASGKPLGFEFSNRN